MDRSDTGPWRLDEGDLRALEVGAAILGTGGGGNPYVGRLRAVEALRAGHSMNVIPLDRLPDGRLQIRGNGVALPFRVFDKDQRVSHAAIVENKRLGAVLAHIKAEQEKSAPKVRVRPSSARNGYEKTGRRPPGRPSRLEKYYAERRAKAACQPSDS